MVDISELEKVEKIKTALINRIASAETMADLRQILQGMSNFVNLRNLVKQSLQRQREDLNRLLSEIDEAEQDFEREVNS